VERTYKEDNSSVSSIYYYGNGLIYEKNSDTGMFVYHYDHLGSTKAVTDESGTLIAEFSYGSYGELLTDKTEYREEVPEIRFLYNGQMGVITDDNNLYYMRARYYNPQIKRFINQDILTGNIGNNKSLNRYSYVEGNPVSYTDPFGLSPYKMISDGIHNTLEALGVIPGIGNIFDGINTAYYLLEGNLPMAFYSAMCAMPYGDIVKLKKYAPKVIGFFGGAEIAAQLLQSAGCDSIRTIFSSETRQYSHFAEYEDNSQFTLDDYLNIALDTSLLTMNVTASFKTPVTGKVDAGDVNVGRVDGGKTTLKHQATSGVELISKQGKTTTILGRYGSDTGAIIDELVIPKSTDFSGNPGGFNLLNTPDELYGQLGPDGFWNQYNKPFLDAAIERGDEILMATPINNGTLYTTTGNLTGYGREYYYLLSKGYEYVDGKMILKGAN